MTRPKYDVTVKLLGQNGNAFFILGRVIDALKKAKASPDEIKAFREEATAGDYDHLLQTCMKWVNVE